MDTEPGLKASVFSTSDLPQTYLKRAVLWTSALTGTFLGFALEYLGKGEAAGERQQSIARVFLPADLQAVLEKKGSFLLPRVTDGNLGWDSGLTISETCGVHTSAAELGTLGFPS